MCSANKMVRMKKIPNLLLLNLMLAFSISPAKSQDMYFNYVYNMLRTERLSHVRSGCVNGKKYNSVNISYWESWVKEARNNDLIIHFIKSGQTIELVEKFMKYYDSALVAVMKEVCPDVW